MHIYTQHFRFLTVPWGNKSHTCNSFQNTIYSCSNLSSLSGLWAAFPPLFSDWTRYFGLSSEALYVLLPTCTNHIESCNWEVATIRGPHLVSPIKQPKQVTVARVPLHQLPCHRFADFGSEEQAYWTDAAYLARQLLSSGNLFCNRTATTGCPSTCLTRPSDGWPGDTLRHQTLHKCRCVHLILDMFAESVSTDNSHATFQKYDEGQFEKKPKWQLSSLPFTVGNFNYLNYNLPDYWIITYKRLTK